MTFIVIILAGLPVASLPKDLPPNATVVQALTTVTQGQEISKVSTLILTIEGILLGFSTVLFDKAPRVGSLILTVTITAIGLILSLVTIVLVDTSYFDFYTVFRCYFANVFAFGLVVSLYVGSSWSILIEKGQELRRSRAGQIERGG